MMGFLREEKVRRYLEALEEERRKIQMFQRELPLCCELVSQAIESYRHHVVCDEEMSTDAPVLEEFMPLRGIRISEEEEEEEEEDSSKDKKKPDWLQSVQLWNTQNSQNSNSPKEKSSTVEANKVKGAFHPFSRDENKTTQVVEAAPPRPPPPPPPPASASCSGDTGGSGGSGNEKESHSNRKPRRCWSPELHRRFLNALQQLGGSHVATPKQIRELMKVDGLTNDEVKSHLQKYRLHTRRPSSSVLKSNCNGDNTQPPPQFILVGGIWVPPQPEFVAAAAAPPSRIYTPIASVPKIEAIMKGANEEGDLGNSNSPATSSSSLTITTSPCLS